jgi:hypothetical protein
MARGNADNTHALIFFFSQISFYFFSPLSCIRIHLPPPHNAICNLHCGANVCKWAKCTTTSFQLRDYTGCIRHVFVLGQCSMVTIGGCGSILRALGVSQILVSVATVRSLCHTTGAAAHFQGHFREPPAPPPVQPTQAAASAERFLQSLGVGAHGVPGPATLRGVAAVADATLTAPPSELAALHAAGARHEHMTTASEAARSKKENEKLKQSQRAAGARPAREHDSDPEEDEQYPLVERCVLCHHEVWHGDSSFLCLRCADQQDTVPIEALLGPGAPLRQSIVTVSWHRDASFCPHHRPLTTVCVWLSVRGCVG